MFRAVTISLCLYLLLMAACAAKPAVTPAPSSQRPPTPATTRAPAVSTTSAEDQAWNDVVAAAKKEGKLNAYSFFLVGDVGQKVTQAFSQKYGIEIDVVSATGPNLAERILTEKRMGNVVADIMDTNTTTLGLVKESGGTVSLSDLPALQEKNVWKIEPWAADPDKHLLMRSLAFLTSIVNTDVVKPQDEPKSFKELTQPKWKGKLLVVDPALNTGVYNTFGTLLRRNLIDLPTVQAVGKNLVFNPSATEVTRLLAQGLYSVDVMNTTSQYGAYVTSGLPVKAIQMEEGTIATNRAMGMIKGGSHPNAAKLFINWVLSKEGEDVYVRAESMNPVRSDIPDFTPSALQIKPSRLIAMTLDDEKTNAGLLKENWLGKLWK